MSHSGVMKPRDNNFFLQVGKMLKKIFTLLSLALFVSALTACGGDSGPAYGANKDAEDNKPLSSDNAEENAATEVF